MPMSRSCDGRQLQCCTTMWGTSHRQGKGHQGVQERCMCPQQWSNTSSANKGCSIASDYKEELLSPFYASAGCPCQEHISLFPKMVTSLAQAKDALSQPTFSSLSSQLAYMQGLYLATLAFKFALAGVMYTYNFCLNQLSQPFFSLDVCRILQFPFFFFFIFSFGLLAALEISSNRLSTLSLSSNRNEQRKVDSNIQNYNLLFKENMRF